MASPSLAALPSVADSATPSQTPAPGWAPRIALLALLALGTYLRFANLADNPGWDGDEGYNWSIAGNLAAGHVQMFGMRYAFVQHPPLFYLFGAGLMRLWTHDLIALRALSALCGVLTTLGLYGLGVRLGGRQLGWAAAAFYTIWPQAVLQIRWAYTYNLLALLIVLCLWAALAMPPVRKAQAQESRRTQARETPALRRAQPGETPDFGRTPPGETPAFGHAQPSETPDFSPGSLMSGQARTSVRSPSPIGILPRGGWDTPRRAKARASRANEAPRPEGRGFTWWRAPEGRGFTWWRAAEGRGFLAHPAHSYRPALLAGLLAGLALATDQEALPLLLALGYLLWPRGWRPLGAGLVMAAIPPALYLSWMLALRRADLLFDLQHTASRLSSGPGEIAQRLQHLLAFDPLIVIGLGGLLLLPRGRPRTTLLLLTVPLTVLILEVRDPAPLFRAAEPLLPLAAVGIGAVVGGLVGLLRRLIAPGTYTLLPPEKSSAAGAARLRVGMAALVLLGPFAGAMLGGDLASVNGRFSTGLSTVLPRSTAEARRMAAWVNARVRPNDLVLVMPTTAWLIHCHTAELLQAVAIDGHGTSFYPSGLQPQRFVYDTRLAASRYLVVDDLTRRWIAESPGERALVQLAERSWPIVYARGEYVIYAHQALHRR